MTTCNKNTVFFFNNQINKHCIKNIYDDNQSRRRISCLTCFGIKREFFMGISDLVKDIKPIHPPAVKSSQES